MPTSKKKRIALWVVILQRFARNGWRVTIDDFYNPREWRSHSQVLSSIRKTGIELVRDEVDRNGDKISRWTIPEEYRPHAIRCLNSKLAGEKIPYANLEPMPTQGELFEIGEMKANAKKAQQERNQYIIKGRGK